MHAGHKTAAVRTPLEFLADVCQSLVIYDDSGTLESALEERRGYILQVTLRSSRCGYVVQGASIQRAYENKEIGKTKGKREMEPAETRIRVRASLTNVKQISITYMRCRPWSMNKYRSGIGETRARQFPDRDK